MLVCQAQGDWLEQVVVASTDFDANQTEKRYIRAVGGPTTSGSYLLELDAPLSYGHWGEEVPTGTEGVHFVQVTLLMSKTSSNSLSLLLELSKTDQTSAHAQPRVRMWRVTAAM